MRRRIEGTGERAGQRAGDHSLCCSKLLRVNSGPLVSRKHRESREKQTSSFLFTPPTELICWRFFGGMIGAMLQFGGLRARMRRVEKEITPIDRLMAGLRPVPHSKIQVHLFSSCLRGIHAVEQANHCFSTNPAS